MKCTLASVFALALALGASAAPAVNDPIVTRITITRPDATITRTVTLPDVTTRPLPTLTVPV
ncbi:hypothetical protein M413DRAFT_445652 [Hebeloma cylindrosporum]|uniref:Uncharacterized protein n=1 Tax=Hebeloma cylindrosporum TaxID=76867 RepID=A0A0C2YIH7_HEBCY|nr:hypothetical protein M413DRAFT_445652 [Hebeloma cylindrosporum h7]